MTLTELEPAQDNLHTPIPNLAIVLYLVQLLHV